MDSLGVLVPGGVVQGGPAVLILEIQFGAILEQERDHLVVTSLRGADQRSIAGVRFNAVHIAVRIDDMQPKPMQFPHLGRIPDAVCWLVEFAVVHVGQDAQVQESEEKQRAQ